MREGSKVHTLQLTYDEYLKGGKSISNSTIGKYIVYEKIGSGAFAAVYKGMNDQTKSLVAIKVLDLEQVERDASQKIKQIRKRLCKTESQIMMLCDSVNLIKCYDVYENKSLKIMAIEFCGGGTLQKQLDSKERIPEKEAILIIKQIINGIAELHKHKIIHRDLKAENILVHNGVYKIADFGFSKQMQDHQESELKQTTLGTITTMAPQVMKREAYGLKADNWSIGVIFFQMIYGKIPYTSTSANNLYKQIKSNKILSTEQFEFNNYRASKQVTQFLRDVMVIESEKRLGWRQLVRHPLFQDKGGKLDGQLRINMVLKDPQIGQKQENSHEERQFYINEQLSPGQNCKPEQLIRLTVKQAENKRKELNTWDDEIYNWVKQTHLQCLKTQLIYEQIIQRIQQNQLLDLSDRDVTEMMYLLATRCYSNISAIKNKLQKEKDKNTFIIEQLLNTVQMLYYKVQANWQKYVSKLTEIENQVSSIISDRFAKIFNSKSIKEKDKFLTGIEGIQYSKDEQIQFTEKLYIKQLKDKIKKNGKNISRIRDYLSHYKQINDVQLSNLKQRSFKQYVNMIIQ